jgi:hypothetical protein
MTELLNFSAQPKMRKPTLVIGWELDTALIGARTTEYLLQNVPQMHSFCDIDGIFAKLESNQPLAEEEQENLVKAVDNCLKRRSI